MNKHINHTDLEDHLRSIGRLVKVPHGLQASIKQDIMTQIITKSISQTKPWYRGVVSWAPAVAAVLVIATSATSVFADSAVPGDALYPLDRMTESIAIELTHDPIAKAKLYSSLADERVAELATIETKRPAEDHSQDNPNWQKNEQTAISQVRTAMAQVGSVKLAVDDQYKISSDSTQKAALLVLSKELQQESATRDDKLDHTAKMKVLNPDEKGDIIPDVSSKDVWNYINSHTDAQREADAKAAAEAFIKAFNDKFKGSNLNPGKDPKLPKETPMNGAGSANSIRSDTHDRSKDQPIPPTYHNGQLIPNPPLPDFGGTPVPTPTPQPPYGPLQPLSDDGSKPCDDENTVPDPLFPGMCYGNNSLIHSGVNTIIHN